MTKFVFNPLAEDNLQLLASVVADISDISTTYLQIDGANANTTIDIGSQNFTTTGSGTLGSLSVDGTNGTEINTSEVTADGGFSHFPEIELKNSLGSNLGSIKGLLYIRGVGVAPRLMFTSSDLSAYSYIDYDTSADKLQFQLASGGYIFDDKIGINVSTPLAKLDIDSSADTMTNLKLKTKQSSNIFEYYTPAGHLFYRAYEDSYNFHHTLLAGANGRHMYYNMNGKTFDIDGNSVAGSALNILGGASLFVNGVSAYGSQHGLIWAGPTTYATAGAQQTTIVPFEFNTFGWNGSDGYTLVSKTTIQQKQLSNANDDARIDIKKFGGSEYLSILTTNGNVGINTITPDTKLQVVGDCKFGDDNTNYVTVSITGDISFTGTARVEGLKKNITTKTANYTLTATDDVVLCNTNTFTITLPNAVLSQVYEIKNIGVGVITVDTNDAATIDGEASIELIEDESISIINDGTDWWII